jgi:hypothetical protein
MDDQSQKNLLEKFVYENHDLEKLEKIANEFNIFTALKMEHKELKHSDMLAWLLNPRENHGMDDYFVKSFISRCLSNNSGNDNGLSIINVDSWDLSDAEVYREKSNIDIVIKSKINRFVCIIENKIKSSESNNQLKRYRDTMKKQFPDYNALCVYLNIEGESASEDDYINISYKDIYELTERLIDNKAE